MTIGEKIRDIRMKRGLTQADLGGELVTPSMISQIEADRAKPSYALLTEIANRLGTPVEYFMNDMDDQFLFSAQLNIAMYLISIGEAEAALAQLEAIEYAPDRGLSYQAYLLALVQVYTKLRRYTESISYLEQLRQIAYRTQDKRLLLEVCRHSGHVEAALENEEGALHEWQRALEIGRELQATDTLPRTDLTVLLTDVLLQLDQLTQAHPETAAPTRPYLQQALELTASSRDLRKVSAQLIEDARVCLPTDAARAKTLAEKANTLLSFANLTEQVITIESALSEANGKHPVDPWQQAILTTTAMYPHILLTSACNRIEQFIRAGDTLPAREFLEHARVIRDHAGTQHEPEFRQAAARFTLLDAQLQYMQGYHDDAIHLLRTFIETFPEDGDRDLQRKACALLVLWYGEKQATDQVLYYCRLMEQLMVGEEPPVPLLI